MCALPVRQCIWRSSLISQSNHVSPHCGASRLEGAALQRLVQKTVRIFKAPLQSSSNLRKVLMTRQKVPYKQNQPDNLLKRISFPHDLPVLGVCGKLGLRVQKKHLRRIMGKNIFSFEELLTFFVKLKTC